MRVKKSNLFFVILAGGSGTRLWPISRENMPKQFVQVGSNNKSLIEQAIDRIAPISLKENIWISTTENHKENINLQVGHKIGKIIIEPCMRNTAPAILLACLEIQKINPAALIVFLPSDPFIPETQKFIDNLTSTINFIEKNNKIALLGIKPTHPATGYGYIEFDNINKKEAPYKVLKFHEKPNLQTAKEYLKENNIIWNIGTFCAKAQVFIQEFETHAPEIFAGVSNYLNNTCSYSKINSDSIDYAIIEKSENVFVTPGNFLWYDVGNIEIFLNIQKQYMQLNQNTILVNSKNNLIKVQNKLVALIGIDDLCVVETDNIILITKRDKSEQVRDIVQQLKDSNNLDYL